jgi:two-component system alkaline phosphatase synthesis response regulator PhoP
VASQDHDETIEIKAFENGADDFLQKPIRKSATARRIQARLLKEKNANLSFQKNGNVYLVIDRESYHVKKYGNVVNLSRKEFELLYLLASQPGKIFTRQELFSKI